MVMISLMAYLTSFKLTLELLEGILTSSLAGLDTCEATARGGSKDKKMLPAAAPLRC